MLSFLTTAEAHSCEVGGVEVERYALEITNEYFRLGTVKFCIDCSRLCLRINSARVATQNLREFDRNTYFKSNLHRHLRSSLLGLVYNDSADFTIFGSTH
jgi:hypothetical protein